MRKRGVGPPEVVVVAGGGGREAVEMVEGEEGRKRGDGKKEGKKLKERGTV